MPRGVIELCNELDALSGRFNPDHVTYLRHHTQKLNGIALVNTLVEELANAPALTLPELYRKVEMLAGLCDADSHPQTGGISNLLNALELSDPAALSHWQKAAQEISKALADTGGPSEVRLLASIWADVAQLSPEYAGIRHVQTLSDVLRERAKEFEQVSPVPDEHCYTLALSEDLEALATGQFRGMRLAYDWASLPLWFRWSLVRQERIACDMVDVEALQGFQMRG